MEVTRNPVGWFEIPVADMQRARGFYESLFATTLTDLGMQGSEMLAFPFADVPGASGALVKHPDHQPNRQGTLIYFTSPSGNLAADGKKAEELGGKVLVPTTNIGEHGFVSVLLDTEGNRIALHTRETQEN